MASEHTIETTTTKKGEIEVPSIQLGKYRWQVTKELPQFESTTENEDDATSYYRDGTGETDSRFYTATQKPASDTDTTPCNLKQIVTQKQHSVLNLTHSDITVNDDTTTLSYEHDQKRVMRIVNNHAESIKCDARSWKYTTIVLIERAKGRGGGIQKEYGIVTYNAVSSKGERTLEIKCANKWTIVIFNKDGIRQYDFQKKTEPLSHVLRISLVSKPSIPVWKKYQQLANHANEVHVHESLSRSGSGRFQQITLEKETHNKNKNFFKWKKNKRDRWSSFPASLWKHNVWGSLTLLPAGEDEQHPPQVPRMISLRRGTCTFGSLRSDIEIKLPLISALHCKIALDEAERGEGTVMPHLEDFSSNGTFVNDERVVKGAAARPLQHGDRIKLGEADGGIVPEYEFRFSSCSSPVDGDGEGGAAVAPSPDTACVQAMRAALCNKPFVYDLSVSPESDIDRLLNLYLEPSSTVQYLDTDNIGASLSDLNRKCDELIRRVCESAFSSDVCDCELKKLAPSDRAYTLLEDSSSSSSNSSSIRQVGSVRFVHLLKDLTDQHARDMFRGVVPSSVFYTQNYVWPCSLAKPVVRYAHTVLHRERKQVVEEATGDDDFLSVIRKGVLIRAARRSNVKTKLTDEFKNDPHIRYKSDSFATDFVDTIKVIVDDYGERRPRVDPLSRMARVRSVFVAEHADHRNTKHIAKPFHYYAQMNTVDKARDLVAWVDTHQTRPSDRHEPKHRTFPDGTKRCSFWQDVKANKPAWRNKHAEAFHILMQCDILKSDYEGTTLAQSEGADGGSSTTNECVHVRCSDIVRDVPIMGVRLDPAVMVTTGIDEHAVYHIPGLEWGAERRGCADYDMMDGDDHPRVYRKPTLIDFVITKDDIQLKKGCEEDRDDKFDLDDDNEFNMELETHTLRFLTTDDADQDEDADDVQDSLRKALTYTCSPKLGTQSAIMKCIRDHCPRYVNPYDILQCYLEQFDTNIWEISQPDRQSIMQEIDCVLQASRAYFDDINLRYIQATNKIIHAADAITDVAAAPVARHEQDDTAPQTPQTKIVDLPSDVLAGMVPPPAVAKASQIYEWMEQREYYRVSDYMRTGKHRGFIVNNCGGGYCCYACIVYRLTRHAPDTTFVCGQDTWNTPFQDLHTERCEGKVLCRTCGTTICLDDPEQEQWTSDNDSSGAQITSYGPYGLYSYVVELQQTQYANKKWFWAWTTSNASDSNVKTEESCVKRCQRFQIGFEKAWKKRQYRLDAHAFSILKMILHMHCRFGTDGVDTTPYEEIIKASSHTAAKFERWADARTDAVLNDDTSTLLTNAVQQHVQQSCSPPATMYPLRSNPDVETQNRWDMRIHKTDAPLDIATANVASDVYGPGKPTASGTHSADDALQHGVYNCEDREEDDKHVLQIMNPTQYDSWQTYVHPRYPMLLKHPNTQKVVDDRSFACLPDNALKKRLDSSTPVPAPVPVLKKDDKSVEYEKFSQMVNNHPIAQIIRWLMRHVSLSRKPSIAQHTRNPSGETCADSVSHLPYHYHILALKYSIQRNRVAFEWNCARRGDGGLRPRQPFLPAVFGWLNRTTNDDFLEITMYDDQHGSVKEYLKTLPQSDRDTQRIQLTRFLEELHGIRGRGGGRPREEAELTDDVDGRHGYGYVYDTIYRRYHSFCNRSMAWEMESPSIVHSALLRQLNDDIDQYANNPEQLKLNLFHVLKRVYPKSKELGRFLDYAKECLNGGPSYFI